MVKGELIGHSGDYLADRLNPTTLEAELRRALSLPRSAEGRDYDARIAPLTGVTEVNKQTQVIFNGPVKGY